MKQAIEKEVVGLYKKGKKYDKYRPKYSQQLLLAPIKQLAHKNRYLDVAAGTGQVFFQIYPYFHYSKGIDISPKMLSVCEEKLFKLKNEGKLQDKKLQFQQTDLMAKEFKVNQGKFDLITVGQALHWLPRRQSLVKMSTLLEKNGILAVYAYILDGINAESQIETERIRASYFEFYDKRIKLLFDYDRDELHNHYSQREMYPFEQIFKKVERAKEVIEIEMPGCDLLSYLQTISSYNKYVEQEKEDPIKIMEETVYADKKYQVNFDYFSILCKNK